jgi:hypothetical protein
MLASMRSSRQGNVSAAALFLRLSPDGPTLAPTAGAPSLRLDATLAIDERPRAPDRVDAVSPHEAVAVFDGG